MQRVHTYDGVCEILANRFQKAYRNKKVNITGLICGIADTPLAKAEYTPIIDFWHYRSDNVTDFFCGGFCDPVVGATTEAAFKVEGIRHREWWFSSKLLDSFVKDIERVSTWRPSGGFDLILCTARFDNGAYKASLDFSSAMCITLEEAKKAEAIRDLGELLNITFEFAKSINEDTQDAAWDYSDQQGLSILKMTLRDSFLACLPKPWRKGGEKAELFAIRDISNRSESK